VTITVSLLACGLTNPLLKSGLPGMQVTEASSVDDNSRRMIAGEFDIAEMSLATFVRAASAGTELVGLPVFPGRRFIQVGMLAHRDSGVDGPRALAGRRVAVPQYWLTSSVWHRGVLREEYGVAPESIEWITTAPERGGVGFPSGVSVKRVEDATIPELLAQGRIDAALVPRSINEKQRAAGAMNLFPDPVAAQRDYLARTGIVPIMHFVAMRRDVLVRAPQAVPALLAAFDLAQRALPKDTLEESVPAVGLAENRSAIERFLAYAHEQQLVPVLPMPEQLFVPHSNNEHAFA
jgi:4,5-dihydroxyphthalate decarboxylase